MPVYLRTSQGKIREAKVVGPYEETRLKELRDYARKLSERSTSVVEAFWVCGRRRPMLLFMYQSGNKSYPRNAQEERQLENVMTCLARPGASAKSLERSPRKISTSAFSKARKLPGRFACPARIILNPPVQDFQNIEYPHSVKTYPREHELSNQLVPPIGPSNPSHLGYPANWPVLPGISPIPMNFTENS